MRKHFAILLAAMLIACGCGKFNDIRITSAKLVSLTPSGLRAVDAVMEVGVDNPAMTFTVAYARGTVYYAGKPLMDYSAQPVTVKRRSSEVYEVNARGTLAGGVSVLSILGMALMGSALYGRFAASVREVAVEDSKKLMDQVCLGMESYIRNMMRISDTTYYAVIKKTDLAQEALGDKMNLLYEANKDSLISIACFTESGELIEAVPVDNMKKGTAVTEQQWFAAANSKIENLHFSIPHVQNLFEESSYRYYWVISLSRVVELNHAGETSRGILLVDMNFSGIEHIFDKVNSKTSGGYVYLMDSEGEIIYHPKQKLLNTNILNESNREAASQQDGR